MIRPRAGTVTVETISESLAAARRVGADVDAVLASRLEAEALVDPRLTQIEG